MTNQPQPPSYIKLPVSIASAPVADNLIVTMTRILGLCWAQGYRQSPAYAPDELARRLDRPRTTLYRHLKKLEALNWLRVSHSQRRIVLYPLIRATGRFVAEVGADGAWTGSQATQPQAGADLREALAEAGIVGKAVHELVWLEVDSVQVRAWDLWTWDPEQEWMTNTAGYIVNRLRQGDEAPEAYVALARLTPEETELLTRAWSYSEQHQGWPSLAGNERLRDLAPLWVEIYEAMR